MLGMKPEDEMVGWYHCLGGHEFEAKNKKICMQILMFYTHIYTEGDRKRE